MLDIYEIPQEITLNDFKTWRDVIFFPRTMQYWLREFTPSYIMHKRAFGTYLLGGLFTLQKSL